MTTTRNCRIRFCENNQAELITSSVSYSSQLSAFPFSNAISKFRSRVWKPSGHFLIDSTNNSIYINDGTDKTVTLTSGSYTTPDLLAAHIQTKLNASSTNWVCQYDTLNGDYRFKITHTGSAILRFSQTTNSVWNTIGYVLSTDTLGTSWMAQEQRNHTEEYAIFDLGWNAPINFVSLIGPLNETFTISNNATVKLCGSNLNQWTSPPFEVTLDVTDKGIMRFLDDLSDTSYRYFKISIIDKLNPLGPEGISIGHIYIGDYITLSQYNVASGIELSDFDPSGVVESESGVLHFDAKTKYGKLSNLIIDVLNPDDKSELIKMYERLGKTTPFYVSLDPTNAISDDIFELTRYVVFDDQPKFKHIISEYYSMSFSVREVI